MKNATTWALSKSPVNASFDPEPPVMENQTTALPPENWTV